MSNSRNIANVFAKSFHKKTCTPISATRNDDLKVAYGSKRTSYNKHVTATAILSRLLFAIFIDSLADKVRSTGVACYINILCVGIFLHADDILLLAPSVSALQFL